MSETTSETTSETRRRKSGARATGRESRPEKANKRYQSRYKKESIVESLRDPGITLTEAEVNDLPVSWRAAVKQSTHWPYPDPDEVLEMSEEELVEAAKSAAGEKEAPLSPDQDVEITPYSEKHPWGKMDAETERQYELFSYYRSLGHARSQADVARHFDVSTSYISTTASSRGWKERIDAWDQYKEQVYTQTVLEGVKEMAAKHAEIARDGIMALSMPFKILIERLEDEEDGPAELRELNIQSLFKLAQRSSQIIPNLMNAERLSRGMPTEISEHTEHHTNTIRLETSDELAELIFGLANTIPGIESTDGSEEYIEAEFEEETSDDVARRAIAAASKTHAED